jgi:hypothetical protein
VARLLAQTLKEEKAADGKLTTIAEGSVNEDAAEEWRGQEDGGMFEAAVETVRGAVRAASSHVTGAVSRGTSSKPTKSRATKKKAR